MALGQGCGPSPDLVTVTPQMEGTPLAQPPAAAPRGQQGSAGRDRTVPYPPAEDGGAGSSPWLCRSGLVPSRAAGALSCQDTCTRPGGRREPGLVPTVLKGKGQPGTSPKEQQLLSLCPGCVARPPRCGLPLGPGAARLGQCRGKPPLLLLRFLPVQCWVIPQTLWGAEIRHALHPPASVSPAAACSCPVSADGGWGELPPLRRCGWLELPTLTVHGLLDSGALAVLGRGGEQYGLGPRAWFVISVSSYPCASSHRVCM